ncbi:hypothetical protein KIN20_036922 [Parelaphostrongylus tenuis]|uniref:Secreted protein n=1 Tax=Parelaphostrongylus tenuis TaxID=148309 RepID=A0AAD5WLN3_PARTN|nr:hypothetical protein KIN20_036922 [Parelaphostrongylus tenuis]
MKCSRSSMELVLLTSLFVVSTVLACGPTAPGQARTLAFNVTEFILPVNFAWTSKDSVASQVAGILRSGMEVQLVVQRLIMEAVTNVLEEQGRSAGLFPAVISSILSQLTVRVNYSPLQCDNVLVNPDQRNMRIMVMAGVVGNCIIIGNTVNSICNAMNGNCMYMAPFTNIGPVPATHRTISGTVSTTNIIMANWSTQMWQSVMNRVARSIATGPFRSHFGGVSVTVGS